MIAVAGAFRSGTNYLKYLLDENYHVTAEFNLFGWKHAGVPILAPNSGLGYPDIALCYVVKNPYAFIVSLHRYVCTTMQSVRSHEDFDRFLTEPVIMLDSQMAYSPQMRFSNPVQYWNHIYWNLETLDRDHFKVTGFNYEELIANPEAIRRVEQMLALERKSESIAVPQNALRRLGTRNEKKVRKRYETEEAFNAGFYLDDRYLEKLSKDHIAFISGEVDPWLMAQRGYELL